MTLRDALDRIAPRLRDEVCVHANGILSRAAFGVRDADTCFYMIGSMGLASSIGLGIALGAPGPPRDRLRRRRQRPHEPRHPRDHRRRGATEPPPPLLRQLGARLDRRTADHLGSGRARRAGARRRLSLDGTRGVARGARRRCCPGSSSRPGPAFLLVRIALGPPGAPGPRIPWTPAGDDGPSCAARSGPRELEAWSRRCGRTDARDHSTSRRAVRATVAGVLAGIVGRQLSLRSRPR